MRCPFPLACMSVLPRPMARGMIRYVVIVFGGIYGILVEPSLTNYDSYNSMGLNIGLGLLTDLEVLSKFKRL